MTSAMRWEREQELLHGALEQEPPAREAWLRAAVAGDEALLADVTSLLAAHQAGGLLGEVAGPPRLYGLAADHVGPYRILRPLGAGGMGAVFLAERTTSDVTQVVALKLLRADYAAPQLMERFIAERRILARLEHPGIARLIDAGQAPDGEPYFAMEFVEGTDLITWARQRRLRIDERLRLMLAVCRAVEYAHRQLVVHRDLKPSNILVGDDGRPRLLDFGIAKLLEPDPGGPAATRTLHWLTPDYASPEQVRGEPVGTASDVYSLGVLLYELLADRRPFELDQLSPAAMEQVICHVVPLRPSERAESSGRLLRGDLDTIVMKALAKEPERRYDSVQALDEDLRRYLDSEPVRARPDTLVYRTTMFVRRHRAAALGALLVLASLVGGLVAVRRQAQEAERARDRAEEALQSSQQVSAFLVDMFQTSDARNALADSAAPRAIAHRGVERAEALAAQPIVQARILDALGLVYIGLGQYDTAHALIARGLDQRRTGLGPRDMDVAESLRHLARVERIRSHYSDAEVALREALTIQQEVARNDPAAEIAIVEDLAFLSPYLGSEDESERYRRQALDLTRRYYPDDAARIAERTIQLALILGRRGEYAEAARLMREAIAARRSALGAGAWQTAQAMVQLGDILHDMPAPTAEAESLYRQALRITRAALGDTHLELVHGLGSLAELLRDDGRYAEAERLIRETLDLRRRTLGGDNPAVAESMERLVPLLANEGRFTEAEQLARDSRALWLRTVGPEHTTIAGNIVTLALLRDAEGHTVQAESLMRQAIAMRTRLFSPGHVLIGVHLSVLGPILAREGRLADAESTLVKALAILRAHQRPTHSDVRHTHERLAAVYAAMGRAEDARRQQVLAGN